MKYKKKFKNLTFILKSVFISVHLSFAHNEPIYICSVPKHLSSNFLKLLNIKEFAVVFIVFVEEFGEHLHYGFLGSVIAIWVLFV